MNIAYFGYDFFADCLEMVLAKGHTVSALYSFDCDNQRYNFNTRIQKIGQQHNIPVSLNKPGDELLPKLNTLGVELIIAAGYPHKLPVSKTIKGINIHPTLLPTGRGIWPLPWIILRDDKFTGVSIHQITNTWDTGDILQQVQFPVLPNETLQSLSCKSSIAAVECLDNVLQNFNAQWASATPQNNSQASYWHMPTEHDRTINLNDSVENIDRIVRAFGNFDSLISFNNQHWLVQNATCWREAHSHQPGTVLTHNHQSVMLAARDGYVCLTGFRENK